LSLFILQTNKYPCKNHFIFLKKKGRKKKKAHTV